MSPFLRLPGHTEQWVFIRLLLLLPFVAAPNGVINLTGEGLDLTSQKFLGPLIMDGANTWPWADTIHTQEANLQIGNLATYYTPFWTTHRRLYGTTDRPEYN